MKKKVTVFCAAFISVGFYIASFAYAADFGEINWVEGYISATGYGASAKGNMAQSRPLARRAAIADAYRNLLETIKGVKLDSSTTVENFVVEQDVIKTQIDGVVKGAKIYKETYELQSDGSVLSTLEMRVCLSNCPHATSVIQALNIDQIKEPQYIPQKKLQDIPVVSTPPPPPKESKITYDSSKPVTGLIINLEGLIFERVLLPVVVAEELGDALVTVYAAKNVNPVVIRTQGVVRYNDTLEQARSNPRIGNNVMIIPVSRITKENMIVIKGEAARLIKETTANGNDYLAEGKIVISAQ